MPPSSPPALLPTRAKPAPRIASARSRSVVDDRIVHLGSRAPRGLEAHADLDALDRGDRHQHARQSAVELAIPADMTAESDGQPAATTSISPPSVSPSCFALVDARDHPRCSASAIERAHRRCVAGLVESARHRPAGASRDAAEGDEVRADLDAELQRADAARSRRRRRVPRFPARTRARECHARRADRT